MFFIYYRKICNKQDSWKLWTGRRYHTTQTSELKLDTRIICVNTIRQGILYKRSNLLMDVVLLALVIIEGEIYTLSNIRQKHPPPSYPLPLHPFANLDWTLILYMAKVLKSWHLCQLEGWLWKCHFGSVESSFFVLESANTLSVVENYEGREEHVSNLGKTLQLTIYVWCSWNTSQLWVVNEYI